MMSDPAGMDLDTHLDPVLERVIYVQRELVWAAWTRREHLKRWFCPRPWQGFVLCD